jgi:hypothetical protein
MAASSPITPTPVKGVPQCGDYIAHSDPNTPAVQAAAFGLVGQAVVTTFPIRKYLGGKLLGSKNGMKLIRN